MNKWSFCITIFCVFIFFACSQPVETGQLVVTSSVTLDAQNTLEPGIDPLMATIDAVNTQNSLLTPSKEINSTEDAMLESIYAESTQQALATKTPIPSVTSTRKPTPTPTPYAGQNVWLAFYGSPMDDQAVLNDSYPDEIYIYAGDLFSKEFFPIASVNALPESFEWTGTSISWANDGSKIAYTDVSSNGYPQIKVIELSTGEIIDLVTLWRNDFQIAYMDWENTDSQYLAFLISRRGYRGLYLVDTETLVMTMVTEGNTFDYKGWDTDSRTIVFRDNRDEAVFQFNAETKQQVYIETYPDIGYEIEVDGNLFGIYSSPREYYKDTNEFLYHGYLKEEDIGVWYLMSGEDKSFSRIAFIQPENFENDSGSDWILSPDGKWMFVAGYDGAALYNTENRNVEIISEQGDTEWLLDWYPDSSALIVADIRNPYVQGQNHNPKIRIINTNSEEVFDLVFPLGQGGFPITKDWNQHLQSGMAMDTVFINPETSISIIPLDMDQTNETEEN
jgi:hypothetical protein